MIYSVFSQRDLHRQVYTDYANVASCLLSVGEISFLNLGGGKGTDELVKQWAVENGVPFRIFPPNIAADAERAFSIRDNEMIDAAEACIVFWDGVFAPTIKLLSRIVLARKTQVVFWM